ncbi:MAG TPA: thermonuclease family protein [Afipia sp.]
MFLDTSHPHFRGSAHDYRHDVCRHGGSHVLVLAGLIFALGVATGSLLPWSGIGRHQNTNAPRADTAPAVRADNSPARETIWKRTGNSDVRHPVEVIRALDGDTFEARVHLWPGLDMTTRVRLRGIDAPELKAGCPQELDMARTASDALDAMLAQGEVTIFNIGPDKYNGRVVADAATKQTPNVSAALLAAGYARSYGGGRRGGWCTSASR